MGLKGGAELAIDDAPWVEKFRPRTLDDVAAHEEIIETSKSCRFSAQGLQSIARNSAFCRVQMHD
jgi:hypothetical protein